MRVRWNDRRVRREASSSDESCAAHSCMHVLSTLRGGGRGRAGPFDPRGPTESPFRRANVDRRPLMGYATKVLIAASNEQCPTAVFLLSDVMRSRLRQRHRVVCVGLAVLWCLGADSPAIFAAGRAAKTTPAPARNILLIHVTPRSTPALVAMEQAFTSSLKSLMSEPIASHSEYVDLGMFDRKETFETQLVAYLAAKYAQMKLDLVAITASGALRFAVRHRARLFPGVPIVFMSVIRSLVADVSLDSDVSGVWLPIDWPGTLAAARRLQPDIERVVVVTGASPIDRSWAAQARAQLVGVDIPITYLSEMRIDTVLERVTALTPRGVVLLGAFLSDATGRRFFGPETTHLISTASPVPVFVLSETQLGYGSVGGHVISFELQGRRGAEIAARMLRGERPPPVVGETLSYRFDARQLRRFNLDGRRL